MTSNESSQNRSDRYYLNFGLPELGEHAPKRGGPFSKWLATLILRVWGWEIRGEAPNIRKGLLIGAPHTSNLDFVLTILAQFAVGVRFSWVAKHSAFKPPFGKLMRWLGGIPLNRSTTSNFVQDMAAEFDNYDKLWVAIMPEGTRSRTRRWKTGFYYIACEAKLPIVMITFDFENKILGVGPTYYPTGDFEKEFEEIKSLFAGVRGRHPTRMMDGL